MENPDDFMGFKVILWDFNVSYSGILSTNHIVVFLMGFNGDSMVIQWHLMGFNGIYDGIASGKRTKSYWTWP